jgi:N,N-dimethylformamidase
MANPSDMRHDPAAMPILGYCNSMSVAPGGSVTFYVSTEDDQPYGAKIVRLINADDDPKGAGFKSEPIDTNVDGDFRGLKQVIHKGSCAIVDHHPLLAGSDGFSLQAMVYPTKPAGGFQGIVTKWSAGTHAGYGLFIDNDACLYVLVGDGRGRIEKLSSGRPLLSHCWYFAAASLDVTTGRLCLYQEPVVGQANGMFSLRYNLGKTTAAVETTTEVAPGATEGIPLLIAAYFAARSGDRVIAAGHFNGKIDRPRVAARAMSRERLIHAITSPEVEGVVAAWDFAAGGGADGFRRPDHVEDVSPNKLHARTINLPVRGVTGFNWDGEKHDYTMAPDQYGAIHFHDDSVGDAGWEPSFQLRVPQDLKSGVYAAHVECASGEDYIPFFVRPHPGGPNSKIAFLIPTNTYLAYANDNIAVNVPTLELTFTRVPVFKNQDLYRHEHRELGASLYDTHTDGSGVCYSSWCRPLLTVRPKYRHTGAKLWGFGADLQMVDWLTVKGYDFDVLTDQDLHLEGTPVLEPYRVVITGSHPEYWSRPMLDALDEYLQNGGRLMYLGGNGFYWVTGFSQSDPNVIEVRRWGGTEAWTSQPGEYHLSFTGELGGLWRNRGRPPQKLVGVGFIAQGLDESSYYRRQPDSFDACAAWIFDGVGSDELIGDFGSIGNGAAGLELDWVDADLGTPPHALLLASSEAHPDTVLEVRENLGTLLPGLGGGQNPKVRADIVYFSTPNDGAVFSVGSIAFMGSLSYNEYENNVSRIVGNVLDRFASDQRLDVEPIANHGHGLDVGSSDGVSRAAASVPAPKSK